MLVLLTAICTAQVLDLSLQALLIDRKLAESAFATRPMRGSDEDDHTTTHAKER